MGLFCRFHLSPISSSGLRHNPAVPSSNQAAACEMRMYRVADSFSSSAQVINRVQHRIKLSCDKSMIDRESKRTFDGGIRKVRPGRRKISTTWITSDSGASQIRKSSLSDVGRLTPRGSENVSVRDLNIRSTILRLLSEPVS